MQRPYEKRTTDALLSLITHIITTGLSPGYPNGQGGVRVGFTYARVWVACACLDAFQHDVTSWLIADTSWIK